MILGKSYRLIVQCRLSLIQCQRFYSSLKILYFGTDSFSLPSLQRLSHEKLSRLEVVTSFKAKINPTKAFAENHAIKVHDWAVLSKDENFHLCREFDLGLVVSFGHLIPEDIINSFKNGMLNVHGSLLPKYRGASPIIYAIKNGDKETGVSIMRLRPKKFDVGEVLANQRVAIPEDILMPELHDRLSKVGAELLVECVKNLDRYQPIEQDHSKASYAPKINNEFCEVRWSKMSAADVYNLYRSIYSFKSPTTSFINEPVKILQLAKFEAVESGGTAEDKPGHLLFCRKSKKLLAKCADENYVEIKQLSIGKKKISAADFNNGFLTKCLESERFFKDNKS